jgi:hypothetical protein
MFESICCKNLALLGSNLIGAHTKIPVGDSDMPAETFCRLSVIKIVVEYTVYEKIRLGKSRNH